MADRNPFMANKAHGRFMEEAHKSAGRPVSQADGAAPGEGGEKTVIHHNGDGSFHVEHSDGSKSDSLPSHLHVAAHVAHHLSGGDKHHITHHDGISMHSHGIHEDGSHEGPEEHEDVEGAKQHMAQFFGDEGSGEQDEPQGGAAHEQPSMAGY